MSVNAEEAEKLIKQNEKNPNFKIIDVRTCLERRLSYMPGSEHIPSMDLEDRIGEFKKENTYLVYCRAGNRSATAVNTLKARGFNAINLQGGLVNWRQ